MSMTMDIRTPAAGQLLDTWLRSLDGVVARLRSGAMVADVGCGHGLATIAMAQAFPRSAFTGYDADAEAIRAARADATRPRNVRFDVAAAHAIPAFAYDLVTTFEGLNALDDPAAAARHVHRALAADGTWMIVEPGDPGALTALLADAGFSQVRVVAETPFEVVVEARP